MRLGRGAMAVGLPLAAGAIVAVGEVVARLAFGQSTAGKQTVGAEIARRVSAAAAGLVSVGGMIYAAEEKSIALGAGSIAAGAVATAAGIMAGDGKPVAVAGLAESMGIGAPCECGGTCGGC